MSTHEEEEANALMNESVALPEEEAPAPEFHGERFTITSTLFNSLREMGFSENAIKKSIASGCINEDTCTQWISMHQGHPELDTPQDPNLVRVDVVEKRVLTQEEVAQKAHELKEKIRLKKIQEAEEAAENERQSERRRVETAKLMLEAKELREAQQRAQAADERRKEKEADARAREKVQMDLAIDKYVRHGKSLEDATRLVRDEFEERKKRQREEAAEKLKGLNQSQQQEFAPHPAPAATGASSTTWNLGAVLGTAAHADQQQTNNVSSVFNEPTVPEPSIAELTTLLHAIRHEAPSTEAASACIATLRTILTNIVEAPLDSKKRTLKASSHVFQSKVGISSSALRMLRALNFELAADAQGQEFVTMSSVVMRSLHRALDVLPKAS